MSREGKCDWKGCFRVAEVAYRPRETMSNRELCERHWTHLCMAVTAESQAFSLRKLGYSVDQVASLRLGDKPRVIADDFKESIVMAKKTTTTKKSSKRGSGDRSVVRAGNTSGRLRGKKTGLSVIEFCKDIVKLNEKKGRKLTDQAIQKLVIAEFPGRTSKQLSHPEGFKIFRSWYNRQGLKPVCHEYDKAGSVVTATRGRPAGKTKKVAGKKTKTTGKKGAKKGAKVRRRKG